MRMARYKRSQINFRGGLSRMAVSYKKLWHMLIDRGMRKKDLKEAAGLTAHTMLKLRHNMHINTTIIYKICMALDCSPTEFIEFIELEG